MLSVAEARALVLEATQELPCERVGVGPTCLGQTLAESIVSDIDSPPFDKAMMDGYAVRSADCAQLPTTLLVVEEIPAGRFPQKRVEPGQAARIFTGAPVPQGADAVIMQEQTRREADAQVVIDPPVPRQGQHILRRGEEMWVGDIVLPRGSRIDPQTLGILATVGRSSIEVVRRPRVGVLCTGDELVEADQTPTAGQIRNSNGPMLLGQVMRAGALADALGIVCDNREALTQAIAQALAKYDLLLLSGGVSVGDYDLIPEVLMQLGVTGHFHKVRMKPGKPLYFGKQGTTLVFGLPGNPLSSFVGFELFVRPVIRKMMGIQPPTMPQGKWPIAAEVKSKSDRPVYAPAQRVRLADERWGIEPKPWFGSANLLSLRNVDMLLELPAGEVMHPVGTMIQAMMLTE